MPTTRACVKSGPGQVALTTLDLPDPPPKMALIRTELSTLCGSDIHIVDHMPEVPAGLPMGHEAVGVVEAVGDGVERFRRGDRVVVSCLSSCGTCARCLEGNASVCQTYGAPLNLLFGAQSDLFLVRGADTSMAKLPAGMSDRHAIFAADIMSTGFGALERAAFRAGGSVAIFAQGPVGLCATAAAKHYGASVIYAVESIPERVAMARQLGADVVLSPENAVDEILAATHGVGVDLAVEALGSQRTFESCLRVTRFGGTVSSVGVYAGAARIEIPTDGTFLHRTIVTTFCPAGAARLEQLLRIMDGGLDLTPLFTHEMGLSEIVEAYDLFRNRRDGVLKIAVR